MATIRISQETKAKLLLAASSGQPVDSWMFMFTRSDKQFQEELTKTAEAAGNTAFFESLKVFLGNLQKEYKNKHATKPASVERPETKAVQSIPRVFKHEQVQSSKKTRGNPTPKSSRRKVSKNYNPTGITFEEFLIKKGLYFPPNYRPPFIRIISGGAVDSNRRRH